MKKYIATGLALGAMMITSTAALAQTETGLPPMPGQRALDARKNVLEKRTEMMKEREDMMEKRNENAQDRMEQRDEHRTDMMKKFDEKTQELRTKFQEMYSKKALRGVAQIENLVARFESHLAKIKATGTDTSAADAQLAVVQANIATAKTKLDALKALYPTTATEMTDEQKTAVEAAKKDVEAAIKAVHESMQKLLQIIKGYKVTTPATTIATTSTSAQ